MHGVALLGAKNKRIKRQDRSPSDLAKDGLKLVAV